MGSVTMYLLLILSSPPGIPIMYMLHLLSLFHSSWIFCSVLFLLFSNFLSLLLSFGSFQCYILKLRDFLSQLCLIGSPPKTLFLLVFFISSISFYFFRTSISLLVLSIIRCYCCCCSVAKLCSTLCNPLDCSITGFPVLYYLPEFAQIHVHLRQ